MKTAASVIGLLVGVLIAFLVVQFFPNALFSAKSYIFGTRVKSTAGTRQVIGFLPYWLVDKAQPDYSKYITTLTYFGLIVSPDGTIQKLDEDGNEEPGWHMLNSEALAKRLDVARKNNQNLSLLVFSGDAGAIYDLVSDPASHAKTLVNEVAPIMKEHGFSDLNLDLENTTNASAEARANFTSFARAVKSEMDKQNLGTLTVETAGIDYIKDGAINPIEVGKIADYLVIMAYDFHYPSSYVSGPVAPIGGGGATAEFDTSIVLQQASAKVPKEKIILGIPSYGYSWETIGDSPKSATLPGSGVTTSNKFAENLLKDCASCSAKLDEDAGENYVIFENSTGTFQQMYYPEKGATARKVALAEKNQIGGIAVWALGYENVSLLSPLRSYKSYADITRVFD